MKTLKIELTSEQLVLLSECSILEINGRRFSEEGKQIAQAIGFKLMYSALTNVKSKAELDNLIEQTRNVLVGVLGVDEAELASLTERGKQPA